MIVCIVCLLQPATNLREGNVFTCVCDSVHKGRGGLYQGDSSGQNPLPPTEIPCVQRPPRHRPPPWTPTETPPDRDPPTPVR